MKLSPATNLPGPIGVTTYGELRVGHALNGVSYTDHKIHGPLTAPFANYAGSLQDAIASAQLAVKEREAANDGRVAVALLGLPGSWSAQFIFPDETVLRVIDNGVGTGGIASAEFTSRSRSLGALVTATGSLLP